MTDTPETDNLARGNHVVPTEFAEQLERERDEAIRSCHIWQRGHTELVAERDMCLQQIEHLLNRLQFNQPERNHIGRWGHNKKEFTLPYINQ